MFSFQTLRRHEENERVGVAGPTEGAGHRRFRVTITRVIEYGCTVYLSVAHGLRLLPGTSHDWGA